MGFLMLVDNLRIKFHWGVYQVHLGGISGTKTPLKAAESLRFFDPKLLLNLFKLILNRFFLWMNFQKIENFLQIFHP